MAFHLRFDRYDNDVMSLGVGSGDASVKAGIDEEFLRRTSHHETVDPEWELGRLLAHQVIDDGFPVVSDKEELRHRLAAEWITTVFRIPGHCNAQDWRWRAFDDTIHTFPGFSDAIPEIVDILEGGRPFFGTSCPDEAYYGFLTYEESCRFLAQCETHRAAFEADEEARHTIGSLIELFQWATKVRCHLWFSFW